MELVFPSFSILLTFLLFLFMVLKIVKRSKKNNEYSNLPPGPWTLPLVGNLHQLVGSLPHHRFRDLAKTYGPFMHLQLGQISCIVVSSPEYAKQVTKTHEVAFLSRPQNLATSIVTYGNTDIGFAPYGAYWRQVRKICVLELLSMKRVQSFRSIREQEISNLINVIGSGAGSVTNLTEKVMSSTSAIISRAAFGQKCKDQESFLSVLKEVTKLMAGFNIADLFPSIELLQSVSGNKSQLKTLHQEIDRILESIIKEHKKCKPRLQADNIEGDEDLIDVLLRVQQQGDLEFPLTTDNIKAVIFDIFFAGSDTSSTTVDWAMSEMIKNPRIMRKAQAEVRQVFDRRGKVDETGISEMEYLKLVIKETLRLHPGAFIPKESNERCEINGFNVPIKTKVLINVWAIGRDPEYWTEPESFNPERFLDSSVDYKGLNFEYIPFGAGRRICPGISFGMANVELFLAMLLYHFDWKLPNATKYEDLDMTESFSLTVGRKNDLLLIPIPYH